MNSRALRPVSGRCPQMLRHAKQRPHMFAARPSASLQHQGSVQQLPAPAWPRGASTPIGSFQSPSFDIPPPPPSSAYIRFLASLLNSSTQPTVQLGTRPMRKRPACSHDGREALLMQANVLRQHCDARMQPGLRAPVALLVRLSSGGSCILAPHDSCSCRTIPASRTSFQLQARRDGAIGGGRGVPRGPAAQHGPSQRGLAPAADVCLGGGGEQRNTTCQQVTFTCTQPYQLHLLSSTT